MRFLLLLPESGRRFPGPIIDDLDDIMNAPFNTCGVCFAKLEIPYLHLSVTLRLQLDVKPTPAVLPRSLDCRKCKIHAMNLIMMQYKSPSMKSLYNRHPQCLAVYKAPFISANA
jgi:hypothetical protein